MTLQEQFESLDQYEKYVVKIRRHDEFFYQLDFTEFAEYHELTSVYTRANHTFLMREFLRHNWNSTFVSDRFTFSVESLTEDHIEYFEDIFTIFDDDLAEGIEVPVLSMSDVVRMETLDVENLIDARLFELVDLTNISFDEAREKYWQYLNDLVDHDGVRAHLPSAEELLASSTTPQ